MSTVIKLNLSDDFCGKSEIRNKNHVQIPLYLSENVPPQRQHIKIVFGMVLSFFALWRRSMTFSETAFLTHPKAILNTAHRIAKINGLPKINLSIYNSSLFYNMTFIFYKKYIDIYKIIMV